MFRRGFLGKYVFLHTAKKSGIVKLDELSARTIFEDIGWTRDYKIFEVMEAKKTVVFHLDDHLKRLNGSMLSASLPFYCGQEKTSNRKDSFNRFVEKGILKILEANAFPASLIWLYFTGGSTNDSFNPISAPNLYIVNAPFVKPRFQKEKGLRLETLPYFRQFPLMKNTNYFIAEFFLPYITVAGYDDIAYSHNNNVLETSKANLFIVKDGGIITPAKNVLLGVTRKIIISLARENYFIALERPIDLEELLQADEVFITNTTKGVWPVVKVDKKSFEVGPITLKIKKIFENYRKSYYKERGV